MITIIDYGMGNLNSINYKLNRLGYSSKITSDYNQILNAKRLLLPGVGHFKRGMDNLEKLGLKDLIKKLALDKKIPILGICLGMQLMTKSSEEGDCQGLSLVDAVTKKFDFKNKNKLRIPHVGWNKISDVNSNKIFDEIKQKYFYFTHSYYVKSHNLENIVTTTDYGIKFVSTISEHNIIATQFHPEKSHRSGFKIIENFIKNFD